MSYKLTYFNARGRGEIIRFVFAQAGVKYEDNRIEFGDWPTVKPTTPLGTLPILEYDGKVFGGSMPIARFLAEKFGLAGANEAENAQIAGFVDFLADLAQRLNTANYEKDEAKKVTLKKDLTEQHLPKFFGILEKTISANPSGWLYGPDVTYVDFRLYLLSCIVKNTVTKEFFDNYPATNKLIDAVEALPNIAEWLKKRPETQF